MQALFEERVGVIENGLIKQVKCDSICLLEEDQRSQGKERERRQRGAGTKTLDMMLLYQYSLPFWTSGVTILRGVAASRNASHQSINTSHCKAAEWTTCTTCYDTFPFLDVLNGSFAFGLLVYTELVCDVQSLGKCAVLHEIFI